MKPRLICTLLFLSSIGFHAVSQIVHVPGDHVSIQQGIDSAETGDTIIVAEGTYFENINFKGKAITVASQFLLDGDASHILKTIIDGSKAANPDSASVVYFISQEDTTSVLCGFKITGGKGTINDITLSDFISKGNISGGGIFIDLSGGKITHNIIEQNHISMSNGGIMQYPDSLGMGGGISGIVLGNHSLIIRDNAIRNNSVDVDNMSNGGGMGICGANIIVEGNEISNNICRSEMGMANGGAVAYFGVDYETGIDIVYLRNNRIFNNALYSNRPTSSADPLNSMGGAIFLNGRNYPYDLKVSNNLMYDNYTEGEGAAIGVEFIKFELSNNTFVDNEAIVDGNDLHFRYHSEIIMYNNILWGSESIRNNAISIRSDLSHTIKVHAFHNLIKGGWEGTTNINADPLLDESTFELLEGSPCIGRGTDSLEFDGIWYYAPSTDMSGNDRPDPIDTLVDMGAIESPYTSTLGLPLSSKASGFSIYPNPANTFLYIEAEIPDLYNIQITSVNGQIMSADEMHGITHQIDLSSFRKGVYVITIRSKCTVTTRKIIKL